MRKEYILEIDKKLKPEADSIFNHYGKIVSIEKKTNKIRYNVLLSKYELLYIELSLKGNIIEVLDQDFEPA